MRYLAIIAAAGLLLMAGCRKDDLVECPPAPARNSSLADFARRNSAAPQLFTITLKQLQTVTTAGGATLTFPARGFLLPNGDTARGTAQVRVRELYSVPDMILANMPTDIVRQREMLVSGGEFNIQVWQNATRLRLSPSLEVAMQSPTPAAQDTTRQYVWNQPANVLASDTAGWQLASARRVQSLPGLYRALLPLDSIGWWNIDQFWHKYDNTPMAQITIKTPASAVGETHVYLRPVGFNGLAGLSPANATYAEWKRNLPAGADMVAIVLQSLDGQLYFGTQALTIRNSLVISPVLTAVSEAEAVRLIRQL